MEACYTNFKQPQNLGEIICFQLFGADIILDKNGNPYLLEINKGPDMIPKFDKDYVLKRHIYNETFNKIGITLFSHVPGGTVDSMITSASSEMFSAILRILSVKLSSAIISLPFSFTKSQFILTNTISAFEYALLSLVAVKLHRIIAFCNSLANLLSLVLKGNSPAFIQLILSWPDIEGRSTPITLKTGSPLLFNLLAVAIAMAEPTKPNPWITIFFINYNIPNNKK